MSNSKEEKKPKFNYGTAVDRWIIISQTTNDYLLGSLQTLIRSYESFEKGYYIITPFQEGVENPITANKLAYVASIIFLNDFESMFVHRSESDRYGILKAPYSRIYWKTDGTTEFIANKHDPGQYYDGTACCKFIDKENPLKSPDVFFNTLGIKQTSEFRRRRPGSFRKKVKFIPIATGDKFLVRYDHTVSSNRNQYLKTWTIGLDNVIVVPRKSSNLFKVGDIIPDNYRHSGYIVKEKVDSMVLLSFQFDEYEDLIWINEYDTSSYRYPYDDQDLPSIDVSPSSSSSSSSSSSMENSPDSATTISSSKKHGLESDSDNDDDDSDNNSSKKQRTE